MPPPSSSRSLPITETFNRRFARHYVEMVVVMMVGMVVVGVPGAVVREMAGVPVDELGDAALLALMGASMTAPMIAWMRFRGHGWRPCGEMAGAMAVPTLLAIALLPAGVDAGALMLAEHVLMLVAMFAAMAARPEEYSHA